jgi:hypothetical protein
LLPRDPDRGTTIRTLAFKGDRGNLHPDLFSSRFADFLNARDIAVRLEETEDRTVAQPWHDYHDIDVLIAVRKPWHENDRFHNKPATKLINAWHAGVPALLGPEYAFRELRKDPLDYIEVSDDDEAMRALKRLMENPDLYQAMVDHGHERAKDFTVERITERWAELLCEKVPQITTTPGYELARALPLPVRRVFNFVLMPPTAQEIWKMAGYLYRTIRKWAK